MREQIRTEQLVNFFVSRGAGLPADWDAEVPVELRGQVVPAAADSFAPEPIFGDVVRLEGVESPDDINGFTHYRLWTLPDAPGAVVGRVSVNSVWLFIRSHKPDTWSVHVGSLSHRTLS